MMAGELDPRKLEQLLGGYSAGTLTPAERNALFQAAVTDQALFDALAEEEPLRQLLADPAAKAELRAMVELPPARPSPHRYWTWLRQPAFGGLALAGGGGGGGQGGGGRAPPRGPRGPPPRAPGRTKARPGTVPAAAANLSKWRRIGPPKRHHRPRSRGWKPAPRKRRLSRSPSRQLRPNSGAHPPGHSCWRKNRTRRTLFP